jgi:hypothetical protein
MSTGQAGGALSAAQERALVRKVDALLMPLLTISYGLQFVSIRSSSCVL